MYFDWVIIYFDKKINRVVIDNFYDCMFPYIIDVDTIGL